MFHVYVSSWFMFVIIMLIVSVLGKASPDRTNSVHIHDKKLVVFSSTFSKCQHYHNCSSCNIQRPFPLHLLLHLNQMGSTFMV
ncbi:unnamed protein product [Brassica rapa subsp. narinosa]